MANNVPREHDFNTPNTIFWGEPRRQPAGGPVVPPPPVVPPCLGELCDVTTYDNIALNKKIIMDAMPGGFPDATIQMLAPPLQSTEVLFTGVQGIKCPTFAYSIGKFRHLNVTDDNTIRPMGTDIADVNINEPGPVPPEQHLTIWDRTNIGTCILDFDGNDAANNLIDITALNPHITAATIIGFNFMWLHTANPADLGWWNQTNWNTINDTPQYRMLNVAGACNLVMSRSVGTTVDARLRFLVYYLTRPGPDENPNGAIAYPGI
jgi:hypothetical protein